MKTKLRQSSAVLLSWLVLSVFSLASAYNHRPKLVVIVVIDQFRGDYLERYHDEFGANGFRLFIDKGAFFTDCYYDYANTETAPGHATLLTGAYSNGHGILVNEWWDTQQKRMVTSVEDRATTVVGAGSGAGSSPHNLMASTLGDELKLATQGRSRVFGIALKDRAAVLPAGWSGDGAYWIDKSTGAWVTSTYYRKELPAWVAEFNRSRPEKYWNREWKDADGKTLATTTQKPGADFYTTVGSTSFGNEYELEFARELVSNEHLGSGPTTDLLVVSLSPNDLLGHAVGPDAPEMHAMALDLDRQLGDFFRVLGQQVGTQNLWLALSADHGVAPVPEAAQKIRIPATRIPSEQELKSSLNSALATKLGQPGDYVNALGGSIVFLSAEAFSGLHLTEAQAEEAAGEALMGLSETQPGTRGYFTKVQLKRGEVPATEWGKKYLHSYSPVGGWWVIGVPPPFATGGKRGTGHGMPYTYDTHVPLAFYGSVFKPGYYRTHAETVDLAATLASLLGINAPSSAVGRVLTEAVATSNAAVPVKTHPAAKERGR
ncbi:MAG TPA: alkaline phosphatase family protein [Terriglobales bacterium]|nr:alkaline phosphatase family protein [Terriglobales bacterium]